MKKRMRIVGGCSKPIIIGGALDIRMIEIHTSRRAWEVEVASDCSILWRSLCFEIARAEVSSCCFLWTFFLELGKEERERERLQIWAMICYSSSRRIRTPASTRAYRRRWRNWRQGWLARQLQCHHRRHGCQSSWAMALLQSRPQATLTPM